MRRASPYTSAECEFRQKDRYPSGTAVRRAVTNFSMDAGASDSNNPPMPSGFHIDKLSDEFGQYTLVLKCSECGHERTAEPHTLGRL